MVATFKQICEKDFVYSWLYSQLKKLLLKNARYGFYFFIKIFN